MPDTDVVIEIEADETTPVIVDTGKDGAGKPKPDGAKAADDGIEALRTQLKAATEAQEADRRLAAATAAERDAAATRARNAEEALSKAQGESADSQLAAIEGGLAAAQAEAEAASSEWQQAQEAGDYAKAREAQRKVARAEARVVRLEEGKGDALTNKAALPKKTDEPARHAAVTDPFERAIINASPRAQSWLREHKEYVTDPKLNLKANAADAMAVSEGYIRDSEAYFDFCERFLGLKEDDADTETDKPKPQTRTRTAMPAAPVSRDGSPSNGSLRGSQVVLTPGEQRTATDGTHTWGEHDFAAGRIKDKSLVGNPIGLKEMARRKAAMSAQGLYDRSYVES